MNYNDYLHICDESKYLISMTTPERIVNLGLRLGFCSETKVLDLCCGYGEMLKIWNDVFDIQGVGVDICNEFIEIGKKRQRDIDKIELICANVLDYEDNVMLFAVPSFSVTYKISKEQYLCLKSIQSQIVSLFSEDYILKLTILQKN